MLAVVVLTQDRPRHEKTSARRRSVACSPGRVRRCALRCAILVGDDAHQQSRDEPRRQPYVTAGDRTYLIGTQDGNFPDMGQHVPGEMGGLWLPPIKLIDAFQARIADVGTDEEILLAESAEMVAYPYGNRFSYGRVLDAIDVDRFQFSPDQQARPDRPVPFQELVGSCAKVAPSMVRQNRSAPRMVCGSSRDPGWSGSSSSGVRTRASSSPGTLTTRGFASGVRCLPRMRGESSIRLRSTRTAVASRPRPVTRSRSAHTPLPR